MNKLYLIEDSDDDYLVFKRACRKLERPIDIHRVNSCDLARDELFAMADDDRNWPDLIFLDLNLPGTDGRAFLDELKQHERLREIPVIVYSTSNATADIKFSYQHHANAYHVKPGEFDQTRTELEAIIEYWRDWATTAKDSKEDR